MENGPADRVSGDDTAATMPAHAARSLVLLYDGLCGFCDGTVRFILARDPRGPMRFAALQGEFAHHVLSRHPGIAGIDSLVVVENAGAADERVLVRSDAVLRIASYLGGPLRLARVWRIVPRPVRDAAYSLFARFRYRIFGRYDACPIPSAEVRARFID
jgi:predicted DCC family thiol-disulfide oxidoreductase YuxK